MQRNLNDILTVTEIMNTPWMRPAACSEVCEDGFEEELYVRRIKAHEHRPDVRDVVDCIDIAVCGDLFDESRRLWQIRSLIFSVG